jgi:hypothetical protein
MGAVPLTVTENVAVWPTNQDWVAGTGPWVISGGMPPAVALTAMI